MPDVAVARYERQTTRCRPSDTFRSTGGRSCRRKKHSCRAYATRATRGNSNAKKKLISLPANRSPAQAMVAQAKMPCNVGLDGAIEEQAHVFAVQRVQKPEAASRKKRRRPQERVLLAQDPQTDAARQRARDGQRVVHQAIGRKLVGKSPGDKKRHACAHDEKEVRAPHGGACQPDVRNERRRAHHEEQPCKTGDGPHEPNQDARVDEQPPARLLCLPFRYRVVIPFMLQRSSTPQTQSSGAEARHGHLRTVHASTAGVSIIEIAGAKRNIVPEGLGPWKR